MPEPFDPYYHWLGIPPRDQPPNLYRLLQLQLFEPNPDVIQNAVDRTMVHLRTFQSGPRAADSQKLLNEVARAKIRLLDPAKKAVYDAELRDQLGPPAEPAVAPPIRATVAVPPARTEQTTDRAERDSPRVVARRPRRQQRSLLVVLTLMLVAFAMVITAWFVLRGRTVAKSSTEPAVVPSNPHSKQVTKPDMPSPQTESSGGVQRAASSTKIHGESSTTVPVSGPLPARHTTKTKLATPPTAKRPTRASKVPPKPLAAGLVATIAAADGFVTSDLALVQNLAWNDFRPLAEQMRPYGYRPVRLRPFVRAGRAFVAAIWHRDNIEWRIETEDSEDALSKLSASLTAQSLVPTDIAGFTTDRTHYVALYARSTAGVIDVRVDIGLDLQQRNQVNARRKADGYSLMTLQEFAGRSAQSRYCEIWTKASAFQDWFRATGILYRDRPMFADLKPPFLPLDITMAVHDQGGSRVVVWSAIAVRVERASAVLSGFDSKVHQRRATELAQQGYAPIAIAVIPFANELIVSSAWRRRRGAQPTGDKTMLQFAGGMPNIQAPQRPAPAPTPTVGPRAAGVSPTGAVERLAVPHDQQLNGATRQFEQKYHASLQKTINASARGTVARELLTAASDEADGDVRYVMYRKAEQLALQAGHLHLALNAITALAAHYKVDELALKEETIKKLLALVRSRTARYALASVACALSERARRQQQYDVAERLATTAARTAQKIRDKRLARAALAQKKRIAADRLLYDDAARADSILASTPDNGDANLRAGKYLCFVVGDWPAGLAHLSKSGDERLASLARFELRKPADAAEQLALAEQWDDWSKAQTKDLLVGGLRRALHWYARAVHGLDHDQQLKAVRQLVKVDDRLTPWLWLAARELPWFDGPPGVLQSFHLSAHDAPVAAAPRNARQAVLGYRGGELVVWDLLTGRPKHRERRVLDSLRQVAMADDSPIVVCRSGRELVFYDSAARKARLQRQQHTVVQIAAAKWEPVFAWATQDEKNNVVAWHLGQGGRPVVLTAANAVHSIALSPDGRTVLVGDNHSQIMSWDLATGKQLGRITTPGTADTLSVSPDGRFILARIDHKLLLYGTAGGNELGHLPDHYLTAKFLPRLGRLVAVGPSGDQIDIWDMNTNSVVQTLTVADKGKPISIRQIQPLADPRAVIITCRNGSAYVVHLPE